MSLCEVVLPTEGEIESGTVSDRYFQLANQLCGEAFFLTII